MRATSETLAPGSRDAATSRSFSSCDHRRRRSTDVISSAREIVIALLLELPLGTAALAPLKQDGLWRRNTLRNGQIFPHVEIPAVGGGVLNLPQDLAGSFGVVIIYR